MKIKIEIKSWATGSVLFEFEKENNTLRDTVIEAVKQGADLRSADLRYANLRCADLSSADLSDADLRSADLRSANLSDADLSGADLRSADLRSANLSDANLRSADLSGAKTDKRYIQIACIGSAKRMTTYCFDDDVIICGCFSGTLDSFEKQVLETHSSNDQYRNEYLGFINYLRFLGAKPNLITPPDAKSNLLTPPNEKTK